MSTVPAEQPLFEEAQLLTSQWSKRIFQEAKDAYERDGDFEKAVLLTRAIPPKSSIFKDVRQTVATWERESKTHQDYLKLAEQALSQSRWQDAVNTAKKFHPARYFGIQNVTKLSSKLILDWRKNQIQQVHLPLLLNQLKSCLNSHSQLSKL